MLLSKLQILGKKLRNIVIKDMTKHAGREGSASYVRINMLYAKWKQKKKVSEK